MSKCISCGKQTIGSTLLCHDCYCENLSRPSCNPSPIAQNEFKKGMKFDMGKTRLELIPTELIDGVGRVLTFGASKYEAENWRNFTEADFPRLVGASMRHMEAYRRGEVIDPESGLPHLAHIATNMGFLLTLDKRNKDGNS